MLQQMQMSGATAAQMNTAMLAMQRQHSTSQAVTHVEENVDTLLAKLEGKGKKVKILNEEEEERNRLEKEQQQQEFAKKIEELTQLQEEKQAIKQDQSKI